MGQEERESQVSKIILGILQGMAEENGWDFSGQWQLSGRRSAAKGKLLLDLDLYETCKFVARVSEPITGGLNYDGNTFTASMNITSNTTSAWSAAEGTYNTSASGTVTYSDSDTVTINYCAQIVDDFECYIWRPKFLDLFKEFLRNFPRK